MRPGRRRTDTEAETFGEVIDAYLNSPKFDDLQPSTRTSYAYLLRIAKLPDVLGSSPTDIAHPDHIRPSQVQAYLDHFADRPAQQKCAQTAIKAVEKWATVRDLLKRPISMGTEAPGGQGGHIPWSDAEVDHAEQSTPQHLSRVITLTANLGQRGSDLVRMSWSDIEVYEGRPGMNVRQEKTGLVIWVPFTQELMGKIATWKRESPIILLKEDGQPFTRSQLSDQWLRERKTNPALAHFIAGDEKRVIHGLRGTACVRLLRAGAHTQQIADMVGMSPPMVKRYTRFASQRENALAAVHYLDRNDPRTSDRERSEIVQLDQGKRHSGSS